MTDPTVTYDPTDDKLRVYFATRQDAETLAPLKAAGFRYAGKQECWHAVWSPAREDACTGLDGFELIEDEPGNIATRADERAERFEDYAANAERERDERWKRDRQVSEQLNGQPILVGHHSERAHRALLKRAWANFHKAGEAHQRASYWKGRAHAPVAWASRKERPDVRARRIKKLEAERRRFERERQRHRDALDVFTEGRELRHLLAFANIGGAVTYGAWSRLDKVAKQEPDAEPLADIVAEVRERSTAAVEHCDRWIAHLQGRIGYERQQLEQQGEARLLEPKPRRKGKAAVPLLNLPGGHEMTKAEWAKLWKDYKGTGTHEAPDGSRYRRRRAMVRDPKSGGLTLAPVTLTDAKLHELPGGAS